MHDASWVKHDVYPDKSGQVWVEQRVNLLKMRGIEVSKIYILLWKSCCRTSENESKKGEDNALSESQKQENKTQAQAKIYVEHSISGIKRFRIIYNQIRMRCQHDMDITSGIYVGLWNFLIIKFDTSLLSVIFIIGKFFGCFFCKTAKKYLKYYKSSTFIKYFYSFYKIGERKSNKQTMIDRIIIR